MKYNQCKWMIYVAQIGQDTCQSLKLLSFSSLYIILNTIDMNRKSPEEQIYSTSLCVCVVSYLSWHAASPGLCDTNRLVAILTCLDPDP